jgi:putative membrane protein
MEVLDGFGMHDGWDWAIGAVMMVLIWGTIIWGGLYLWRRSAPKPPATPDGVAILRERFARGEIERTEFEERLAELRRSERR